MPTTARMLLVLVALAPAALACAEEPRPEIPPELILERFPVAKGGDFLLVPVRIAGRNHLFLVDTGCSITVFDASLPLGEFQGTQTVHTPVGEDHGRFFGPPNARIGRLPLRVPSVLAHDLQTLRDRCGQPIEGCLGMDFLKRYAMFIDFNRGEMMFLKSVPEGVGDEISLEYEGGDEVPRVLAAIGPAGPGAGLALQFRVDTGWANYISGSLEEDVLRSLVESGDLHVVGSSTVASLRGVTQQRTGQGHRLSLGRFAVERPVFNEATDNILGIGFWSRFVVTFDFPGKRVYLRRGANYSDRDLCWNLSGIRIERREGSVVVSRVTVVSPGAAVGIRPGDTLLQIGDLHAETASLFELRRALSREGTLNCVVRRGLWKHRMTLVLRDPVRTLPGSTLPTAPAPSVVPSGPRR